MPQKENSIFLKINAERKKTRLGQISAHQVVKVSDKGSWGCLSQANIWQLSQWVHRLKVYNSIALSANRKRLLFIPTVKQTIHTIL